MAPSRRLAANGFDRGGWESARIAMDSSGRATLYSGSMSQGHGHATALAQIAADVLQMPVENIDVVQGDTKQVQAGHGTFNSRSMPVGGSAVHVCAGRIVEKAKKIAAQMMEVAAQDIAFDGGRFSVPGTNIEPLPFARAARMAYLGHILPDGIEPGLDETLFYDPTGMGAPSAFTWHMSRSTPIPDWSRSSITSPSTTPVRSSIRCSLEGKSMAAWSRASARPSMKKRATIPTAASF
jgi:carbon-monoxide dehydrogenase large subunit